MSTINDRIAQLLIKHLEGGLSDAERRELDDWMNNSELNRESVAPFLEEEALRQGIGNMYRARQEVWHRIQHQMNTPAVVVHRRSWWRYVAAAAVVLFALAGGYFIFSDKKGLSTDIAKRQEQQDLAPGHDGAILTLADGRKIVLDSVKSGPLAELNIAVINEENNQLSYRSNTSENSKVEYNTMQTPRGRQYSLVLPDGSKAWLNAASSITYPTSFGGNDRRVSITGEVYFEIAHNNKKPFHVSIRRMDVMVTGTAFNINGYDNEAAIKTTLVEGSIKVSQGGQVERVKPGEQVVLKGDFLSLQKEADIETALAWKNGYTKFKSADIRSIMRQVERWYDIDVIFEGAVPERTFTGGVARTAKLSELLKILELSNIHCKVEGDKLIVMP